MFLKVSAGPTKDSLRVLRVNDESHPIEFDSSLFTGRLVVRIRDFAGITPNGTEPIRQLDYFNNVSRRFSIQVEGRFKRPVSGNDLFFGNDFDQPVKVPKGANVGFRIAQMIDPAVFYDIRSEKPWIMSPVLCSMNVIDAWSPPSNTTAAQDESSAPTISSTSIATTTDPSTFSSFLGPWQPRVDDNLYNILKTREEDIPADNFNHQSARWRRNHFLSAEVRNSFVFSSDRVYAFEFYAPFMDFNTFHLRMGLSFDVAKHLKGQPVRYTCRTKPEGGDGSENMFSVEFELVNG
ncbi:hypothetical protein BC936DRAFT_148445 [Jimgerdemannia flammicorona]|uniref:Domain of unknown function at the cortex 1 domain-containing protein n=2 Tax=Jimgerdemannia flammicorona TaxID=994334 RepID=A0A433D322_9FUNG|nr:hypothetical protein BC936DRAFT_148445 [Jimgerdemannia flammicorona]